MLRKILASAMGKSDLGWLQSWFHFSFAEYYNPDNMHFGALRVMNDDLIAPETGFDMHPHKDMEIITYVVQGLLAHKDNMGHEQTLQRGEVQYMSAGTGVWHSEHNAGHETLRILQIWVFPDKTGYKPSYGGVKFNWDERVGKPLHLVSSQDGEAPIKIHQNVNFYALFLPKGQEFVLKTAKNRQCYLVLIEGALQAGSLELQGRDALEIIEEDVTLTPSADAHFLWIDMAKANG